MRLVGIALFWLLAQPRVAQAWDFLRSENADVNEGNALLAQGEHEAALAAYDRAASDLPESPGVQLDRGLSLLHQEKLAEARDALRKATLGAAHKEVRAKAHYNLGLSLLREADETAKDESQLEAAQNQLREAVDAFKQSLRAVPGDADAAWNLELAQRRLVDVENKREQQQNQEPDDQNEGPDEPQEDGEQEQNQPGDQDQAAQDQEDGQDEAEPDEPDEQGDQDEGDTEGQKKSPPDEPQQEAGQKEPEGKKGAESQQRALPQHMERALDALSDGEENLQKHQAAQRAQQRPRRIEKDW